MKESYGQWIAFNDTYFFHVNKNGRYRFSYWEKGVTTEDEKDRPVIDNHNTKFRLTLVY